MFPLNSRAHLDVPQFSDEVPPADGYDLTQAIYPLLQPGDALCLGLFVIHGSAENTSKDAGRWRRSFINGFGWPGATVGGGAAAEPAVLIPIPRL